MLGSVPVDEKYCLIQIKPSRTVTSSALAKSGLLAQDSQAHG
jgi:hypothetical protein